MKTKDLETIAVENGFVIVCPNGDVYKCDDDLICDDKKYTSLRTFRLQICKGEVNFANYVGPNPAIIAEMLNCEPEFDCIHPCAIIIGLLEEILGDRHPVKTELVEETLDCWGWLDRERNPDHHRMEKEVKRRETVLGIKR